VVVKYYDSKVSLGSLKFTLTATLPSSDNNNNKSGNDDVTGVVGIRQLVFCGCNDAYLIATLSSSNNRSTNNPVIIWDLNRGVVSHTINLPKHSSLCTITASHQPTKQQHLYLLLRNSESNKLVVYVHDLLDEKAKLVKKIKIGSCDEADNKAATSFAMAINDDEMEPKSLW